MAGVTLPPRLESGTDDLAQLLVAAPPDMLQAFSAHLALADAQEVESTLAEHYAIGWRSDPATMAHHLTGGDYRLWPYIRLLSQKFVDAVEGRSKRQIWNLPSRFGKSLLVGGWGPVWCLDRYPTAKIIISAYGDDLANEDAVFVRDTLQAHRAELRTTLRLDRRRLDRFVTEQGGGLMAAGINSAITGFGAGGHGGVVVDDPFKNWQEAHSGHQRDHVWNQYRSVLRTRLDDGDAWIIVVHTRWHEDDLTGRLVKGTEDDTGEEWEVTALPSLAEDGDVLGRAVGEPIEPERFTLEETLDKHRGMGTYLVSALEQQRPAPEEGNELLRSWWRIEDQLPPRYDDMTSSWDMKLKEKETGDYTVGQVWGRVGSHYYLVDGIRGQWNQVETRVAMCLLALRYPSCKRHVYENAGYGPEVAEQLKKPQAGWQLSDEIASKLGVTLEERPGVERLMRRGLAGIVAQNVKGSKVVRMRAYLGIIEAGDVHLNGHWPGLASFLDETAAFPDAGAYDDQVDACSQALKRLSRSPARASAATGKLPARAQVATATGPVLSGRRSHVQGARRPGSQPPPPGPSSARPGRRGRSTR